MKHDMIATKPFRYATRALAVGDEFSANRRDARVLEAIGKARRYVAATPPVNPAPKPKPIPMPAPADQPAPAPTAPPEQQPKDALESMRRELERMGGKVDSRWREKRLSEEIEAAKKAARD